MHRLAPIALLALCFGTAPAQTLTAKIDSYSGPGDFILACPCFVAGEEAAVWLDAPCPGRIVAVQVYWDSIFGGGTGPVDAEIRISREGTFPEPGALVASVPVVTLTAGIDNGGQLNEIALPGSGVAVAEDERFVVSFRFLQDATNILFSPSVNFDDAVTPGRNAVLAEELGWIDEIDAGLIGDWVIRAVVECGDPTPAACCLPATRCALYSESDCAQLGGTWAGEGTTCPTDCPKLCKGDIDGDGKTTAADFNILAAHFSQSVDPGLSGDLTGNGLVDSLDFNVLAGNFGCRND